MSTAQIHDLGYRGYDGERLGEAAVARSLFVTGLRHIFGLGRSLKSRLLPIGILVCSVLPALIMVAITVMTKIGQLPVPYERYPMIMQMLTSIFVAAQAPVIFSRDLRYRSITLYLARPLRRTTYVMARLASLAAGTLIIIGLPVLVLWLGALLGGLPWQDESLHALKAVPGILVLTAVLTVVSGAISSLTTKRGIAVVAIIATLIVSSGVANAVAAIVQSSNGPIGIRGSWAGVLNPFTLADGLQSWWFGFPTDLPATVSGGDGWLYLAVLALTLAGATAVVLRRYAKAGAA
ncbi:ABC transporter permease [Arsenicicoccus sp. oral taxon 190]|uniref:ABC transporter permease n=1 Tax=Arsenicicoccus sp. oral taxon 190 TaxID=1658671 RepID=UPI00067A0D5D|nr:ABC transporter permease [Arsenicicoccus sp. oral taxon 190]AKT50608.1 hypothetical protein ADJ73_03535 [Arsenicicoccus sp. oral taxon 190]